MKIRTSKVIVTEKFLTIGLVLDYGGPIRFNLVKVPLSILTGTGLCEALMAENARQLRVTHEEYDAAAQLGLF